MWSGKKNTIDASFMTEGSYKKVEAEFLQAYEAYADAIFRHCLYRVYERERAVELVQDTFMKTWEVVSAGEEIRNIRAYLYRVAHNLIVDEARRRKIRKSVSLDELREDTGFDPGHDERPIIDRRMQGDEAMKLLMELSSEDKEVLVMRYVDELEPREISTVLNVSPNVVSVRLHRALKRLKELVSKHD